MLIENGIVNKVCRHLNIKLWVQLTTDCDVTDVEKNQPSRLFGKDANAGQGRKNESKVIEDDTSHEEGELSPKGVDVPNNGHGNKAANQRNYLDGSDRSRFLFLSNSTCVFFWVVFVILTFMSLLKSTL